MRFAPVLLLVTVATVALSVEGHVVKRSAVKWHTPLNDEFDDKIGLAFKKYNRVSDREWFGPVAFQEEKMKSIGRLGRFHMYYRDGSFGMFSYAKGEQDGEKIVKLHYTYFTRGGPPLKKEKIQVLKEGKPYQMFGMMRKFIAGVKQSERKRLGLDNKANYFFVVRNVMWFRMKKANGKYSLSAHSRIFINQKRKDYFSKVFDLESGSMENVVDALAKYWYLVRARNIQQYRVLMAAIRNEGKAPAP